MTFWARANSFDDRDTGTPGRRPPVTRPRPEAHGDRGASEEDALRFVGGCAGWLALACAGFGRSGPEGCPSGSTQVESPAGRGDDRWVDDTSLTVCTTGDGVRTGPQLERYPTGAIAAEGHWADGLRDGTWTRWTPEGAFDGRVTYRAGVESGPRWEVDRAGSVTEITLEDGRATGWRALDPSTPMPEWDGDRRVDGTRYSR